MFANAGSSRLVCIWTERAASVYISHNFWCAAAVSAAVYVGVAVVAGVAAGPLAVGRVNATISAAAPSTRAIARPAACQILERGAGGWVGVHCPVVGGGVLVTRVRLLQLSCLCTPLHVSSLRWLSSLGLPWRCRGWGRWSVRLGGSRWFCGVRRCCSAARREVSPATAPVVAAAVALASGGVGPLVVVE